MGMACETVALLVEPPDRFEEITGGWFYRFEEREVVLDFWDGHLYAVTLQLP